MRDSLNRARWSNSQRHAAREQVAERRGRQRAEELAALHHQLAAFEPLAGDPLADKIIATARADIARLIVSAE